MRRALSLLLTAIALLAAHAAPAAEGDGKPADAPKPVVPVFKLTQELAETPGRQDGLFSPPGVSLRELVHRIDRAASDPAVKAMVLTIEGGHAGLGQIEELRQAIARVRAAGKEVFAHTESAMTADYLLLCGASRISAVPTADLWVTGLYSDQPYLRGLLNKIGVLPEVLTCGAYKSAAELFMRAGPTSEAEKMTGWLLDSVFDTAVTLIARGRNVTGEKARKWIDEGPYTAEKAREAGLIDAVEHRHAFIEAVKEKAGDDAVFDSRYGNRKREQVDFSSPFALFKLLGDLLGGAQKTRSAKDAVAIVYVEGPIVLGEAGGSPFGGGSATGADVRRALDEAAADPTVKAVVLRVDSPGGSATASEIILEATRRVKAKKPLVVSMGNMAGSGGYYVACAADVIFADEATLTGSIGVVGGKFVTTDMWGAIGVTFKPYQRGKNAAILNTDRPWTPEERGRVQDWMNEIYGTFKRHVTDIRGGRLKKPIEELAGGRVYTGRQALELGLVDRVGTLRDAVLFAAEEAKVTDYDVRVVPEPTSLIERLMQQASGAAEGDSRLSLREAAGGAQGSIVDIAAPHLERLDPQRVKVIKTALGRLELMRREGVVLMMPEIVTGR